MKFSKKMLALTLVCLFIIEPCSLSYATGNGEIDTDAEMIQQSSLDLDTDVMEIQQEYVEGEENDDPGAGRYQGFISDGFFDDSGIQIYSDKVIHDSRFEGYTIKKGIDVSVWNGTINWDKVKNDGIEFAIIRGANRGYGSAGTLKTDTNVEYNLKQAEKAGISVGAYIFSQAITVKEAIEEANYLMDVVEGYNISLPLVFDFEYASDANGLTGRLYEADLSVKEATEICRAFCETVENAGYKAMVYANKSMLENDLDASQISKDYQIWLAHYTTQTSYKGEYDFWQQTTTGSVNGIEGNVDINYWYIKSAELIESNGEWLYYIGDDFQEDFTGLEKINSTWYYIKNGKWQKNYTGLVKYNSGTQYYVKNGTIQHGFTGLIKYDSAWYYIVKGRWQSEYTGLAEYSSGTQYYVQAGKIQHGFTGLLKLNDKWCYISGGKYEPDYTGIAEYASGSHYYMKNGSIQYGFTGLIKLKNIWYYVVNGRWQSDFTGLAEYSTGTRYYVENGLLRHDFTGLISYSNRWYYITDGRWHSDFTGLAKYSTGSWYYVANGIINYNYTGFVEQGNYIYYVKSGKWQKNISDSVIIDGIEYTVSNGLLD